MMFSLRSLLLIENSSDKQRLWSDCAYAQADLRFCGSHKIFMSRLICVWVLILSNAVLIFESVRGFLGVSVNNFQPPQEIFLFEIKDKLSCSNQRPFYLKSNTQPRSHYTHPSFKLGYKIPNFSITSVRDNTHARIQKVLQEGGPTLTTFFQIMRDRGSKCHLKWTIIGPPAKRHLNDVSLAGRWWPNIEWLLGFSEVLDLDQYC